MLMGMRFRRILLRI